MRGRRPLISLTCGALALAALAWAAPPPPTATAGAPPPSGAAQPGAARAAAPPAAGESFGEAIEVSVVNVDVVVRDPKGNQVRGLAREDFSLFVDGKPVDIVNFSAPGGGGPPASGAAAAGAAPAAPGEGAARRERLQLVVYVDNANTRPFDRNRLLKQLRAFLQARLAPGDQVLVVTDDPGLHTRHAFREGLESLAPMLDKLEKESAVGLNRDLAWRQTMDQMEDMMGTRGRNCGTQFEEAKALARAHAESVLHDTRTTYANLHHLLKSLGGLDGRKAILYVGNGVPAQPGTDAFGLLEELCPAQQSSAHLGAEPVDATAPMRQVIADANANLVTFYTLEAAGVQSYVSAERLGRPPVSVALLQRIAADRQDSLTSLARETGGRAALNGSDFSRDLEEIGAEIGGAYSLGFTPVRPGAGRPHEIRVEVKRAGLRTSYRRSYRERTSDERLEGQVEAALIHGLTDNPLGASLKVGAGATAEHGRVLVAVQVRVPFGKLAYVPQEDGRHGHVSIVAGNLDAKGGMAPFQRLQLPLRIPEADARKVLASQLGYDVKLLVEPGRQRIAFALRDDVARIVASVIQELDVDKNGTATAVAASAGLPGSR
jgi:VWFA-related protein